MNATTDDEIVPAPSGATGIETRVVEARVLHDFVIEAVFADGFRRGFDMAALRFAAAIKASVERPHGAKRRGRGLMSRGVPCRPVVLSTETIWPSTSDEDARLAATTAGMSSSRARALTYLTHTRNGLLTLDWL